MPALIAPGAIVRCGSFGDQIYVVRCRAGRNGYWHLARKTIGLTVLTTRVAKADELVAPPPTFKNGETVKFEGREGTVIEDRGDEVSIVVGVARTDAPKSALVLERL